MKTSTTDDRLLPSFDVAKVRIDQIHLAQPLDRPTSLHHKLPYAVFRSRSESLEAQMLFENVAVKKQPIFRWWHVPPGYCLQGLSHSKVRSRAKGHNKKNAEINRGHTDCPGLSLLRSVSLRERGVEFFSLIRTLTSQGTTT